MMTDGQISTHFAALRREMALGLDLLSCLWACRYPVRPLRGGKYRTPRLERDDKEKDAFVHASAVKAAGMRFLNEGDKLEFTLEDGPKGPSAVNLKKID